MPGRARLMCRRTEGSVKRASISEAEKSDRSALGDEEQVFVSMGRRWCPLQLGQEGLAHGRPVVVAQEH
eukprot:15845566-Heterocapsa_arctica.AAC.1